MVEVEVIQGAKGYHTAALLVEQSAELAWVNSYAPLPQGV